jgi:hypothetical protein
MPRPTCTASQSVSSTAAAAPSGVSFQMRQENHGIRPISSHAIMRWSNCTVAMLVKKLSHSGSTISISGGTKLPFISGKVL